MDILRLALEILAEHPMCDHCLGRQYALLGRNMDNRGRGKVIKTLLTMKGHGLVSSGNKQGIDILRAVAVNGAFGMASDILGTLRRNSKARKPCFLCEGVFEHIDAWTQKAKEKLKSWEFTTFLVGVELPVEVAEREDEFKAHYSISYGESMKSQFSRNIGKKLSQATEKEVEFGKPDLVVLVNPFTDSIRLQINPLYIAGRYRKLSRDIPQSRWLCRTCRGKGCASCGGTGRTYQESVEEYVSTPTMKLVSGKSAVFHGAGREDVDARMLGLGRPFVLEIKEPKRRFIDLQKLERMVNDHAKGKVEVAGLQLVSREAVRHFKREEAADKIYRVIVEFDRAVSDMELGNLEQTLSNSKISQQTPRRVLHRRANLTREKYIYKANTKRVAKNRVEMQICCQGGLYIKELVTGDEGRTSPSIAAILDTQATPLQLDVLNIILREEK